MAVRLIKEVKWWVLNASAFVKKLGETSPLKTFMEEVIVVQWTMIIITETELFVPLANMTTKAEGVVMGDQSEEDACKIPLCKHAQSQRGSLGGGGVVVEHPLRAILMGIRI